MPKVVICRENVVICALCAWILLNAERLEYLLVYLVQYLPVSLFASCNF